MAMESFRASFLNNEENQDVNLDAILGELCELESQLNTTQSEISKSLGPSSTPTAGTNSLSDATFQETSNDPIQAELDALAAEITKGLGFNTSDDFFGMHSELTSLLPDSGLDVTETDSAYSDNASLPSSESFTSMATVSSSADTSSTGDACSTGSTSTLTPASTAQTDAHARVLARLCTVQDELYRDGQVSPEEQKARLQAEKIRIALEKIKEAKIKKLFVRAFGRDGSSKSILVDEKMTVGHVCNILADKNHMKLSPDLAVVEYIPDLYIERILEDHDSLVENMVMWTRDSKNKILFEERTEKNDLFKNPEKYLLLGTSSEKGISLDPNQREKLLQEFFSGSGVKVPEVESVLYLKSDGKKAWKKFFFVLRASGLYYNPKGKFSKASKDLTCLVQFDYVDVYHGIGWKKKYHAPTDYCFALKHPQIQKKTSKYIRYLCAENKSTIDLWIMGIRIAKYGKQLLTNYERLLNDISTWDSRNSTITNHSSGHYERLPLKTANLQDSRMSIPPELSSRLSLVTMKNATLSRNRTLSSTTDCDNPDDMVIEVTPMQPRKSSISGPIIIDSPQKAPVKRVSFSNTHCIINADAGEELVPMKHRDSITSASTDSSEESNSSGENKTVSGTSLRGKMKPKLPVTTGTTRQISEMVQMAMEDRAQVLYESIMEEKKPTSPYGHLEKPMERRKSAPAIHDEKREVHKHERKPSEGNCNSNNKPDPRMLSHYSSMAQAATSNQQSPPQKPVGQVPPLVGKHVGQVPPSPPFQREEIYMKKMNGPPLTPPPVATKPVQGPPSVPPPTPPIQHQKLNQLNSHGTHSAQSPAGQTSVAAGRKMLVRADSESAASTMGRAPLCISAPMSQNMPASSSESVTSTLGRGPVSISGPISSSSDYGTLPGRTPIHISGPVSSSDYATLPQKKEPVCVPVPTAPASDYAPSSIVRGSAPNTSPVPPPMPGIPTESASANAISGRPPVSTTNPQASALPAYPSSATTASTTKMPLTPPQPSTPTQSPSMPPMPPQMPLLHIAPMGPPPVAPPPPPQPTVKMGPPPPPPAVKPNKIPQPPPGNSPVPPPMPSCAPPMPGQVPVRPPPISLLAHTKKTALSDTNGTPLSINVNNKDPPLKTEALSPNSQSSLPFLEELSKRSLKPKPQVGPPTAAKPSQALREHAIRSVEQAAKAQAQAQINNSQYQQSRQGLAKALALETQHSNRAPANCAATHPTHQRTHSDGKKPPPPPPKRSESTKLSTDNVKALRTVNAASGKPEALNDNGNHESVMTIEELPPPPPDFLEGLANPGDGSSLKKGRPPPPPPKRSKDTQLTHH